MYLSACGTLELIICLILYACRKASDGDYINITSPVDNWCLYAVRNVKIETTMSDILKIDQTGGYFDSVEQLLKNEDMQYFEYERYVLHMPNAQLPFVVARLSVGRLRFSR